MICHKVMHLLIVMIGYSGCVVVGICQTSLVRNKSVKPYCAEVKKKKKGKVVLVCHHWVSVCLMMSFHLKFMTLGSKPFSEFRHF